MCDYSTMNTKILTLYLVTLPLSINTVSYSTTHRGFTSGGPYMILAVCAETSLTLRFVGGDAAMGEGQGGGDSVYVNV